MFFLSPAPPMLYSRLWVDNACKVKQGAQSLWDTESEEANSEVVLPLSLKDMMTHTWPREFTLSGVALKRHLASSQTELGLSNTQTHADKRARDEMSIWGLLPVSKNIKASHFEGNYSWWSRASQPLNDRVAKPCPSRVHTDKHARNFFIKHTRTKSLICLSLSSPQCNYADVITLD